jgi:hypothetical protein
MARLQGAIETAQRRCCEAAAAITEQCETSDGEQYRAGVIIESQTLLRGNNRVSDIIE